MKTLIFILITLFLTASNIAFAAEAASADTTTVAAPDRTIQKVDVPEAVTDTAPKVAQKAVLKPLPYTFQVWKKRKSVDAQNKLSRLINRILDLKSSSFEDSVATLANKSERSALAQQRKDEISSLEVQKQMALEELEDAKSFTFDQYLSVYVRTLAPENLKLWVENAKPEDTKKILSLYLSSKLELTGDAIASSPLEIDELSASSSEKIIKN